MPAEMWPARASASFSVDLDADRIALPTAGRICRRRRHGPSRPRRTPRRNPRERLGVVVAEDRRDGDLLAGERPQRLDQEAASALRDRRFCVCSFCSSASLFSVSIELLPQLGIFLDVAARCFRLRRARALLRSGLRVGIEPLELLGVVSAAAAFRACWRGGHRRRRRPRSRPAAPAPRRRRSRRTRLRTWILADVEPFRPDAACGD